ncbi:MAG: ECF transporter S component [Coriobacteriales bacterium]
MSRLLQALETPLLVAVPCALVLCAVLQLDQAALLSVLVACAALLVFMGGWETSKPTPRQVMPTVVLAALAAAGRILFAPIPDFKPVTAICIIAGIMFGKRSGFMVGALAALASNFFFGQGPWTPWQMYAWGLSGYVAGALAARGVFERHPRAVYAWGFVAPLIFGALLNGWYVIGFVRPIEPATVLLAYAAGLPLDILHSVATELFLLLLYAPWVRKLTRIRDKYALKVEARGHGGV